MALLPTSPNIEPAIMDFDDFIHGDFSSSSLSLNDDAACRVRKSENYGDELRHDSDGHVTHEQDCCMDDLLEEAMAYFGTTKPAFCVTNKGENHRVVKLIEDHREVRVVFRQWPKTEYGFWVYTDLSGEKHIVKCDCGRYYVWQGIVKGFSGQPLAQVCPIKQHANTSPVVGSDAQSVHSLRKRTARQEKPYSMYNLQIKNEKRGILSTDAQLEACLESSGSKKRKYTAVNEAQPTFSASITATSSSPATQLYELVSPTDTSVVTAQRNVLDMGNVHLSRAILRTRLNSFIGPSMPVYLSSIQSCDQLFDRLRRNWAFKLEGREIDHCIIKFGWLDENHNILLREGDGDGFRLLLDEFQQSAARNSTGLMNADLDLRAVNEGRHKQ